MTHAAEKFIMESAIDTSRSSKKISLSRNLVVLLIILFVCCIVATGLLVYHFASCSSKSSSASYNELKAVSVVDDEETRTNTFAFTEENKETVITTTFKPKAPVAATSNEAASANEVKTENLDFRLPKSVVPHSYKLKLIPFIYDGNFTFLGEVTILVNVTEVTSTITLHADDLEIQKSSINVYENTPSFRNVEVTDFISEPKRHFIIIRLQELLQPINQYYVNIKFKGTLNNLLQGFYRSSYTEGKVTRWIAATQFQPTDARRAFPCFDEPELKAKFKLSIGRAKDMTSISNMPKIGTSEEIEGIEGYVWDHFHETVPMSTYLLAIVVSDFEAITNGTFSVWVRHSAIAQAKYSLQIGPDILKFYEKYFGIDFPLPKIDMAAVPDFSSGAMENWGLILFRESLLLFEDGMSSKKSMQSIATVVAHELAHQWFGNLVTPSWWTDLWLNEGFATYVEYIGTDAIRPDWKILDQFVVHELQNVFMMDALKSSHQISIKVNNPNEINDIFDKISYAKGATIIRMMDNFLTTTVFRKGLTNYLNKRKYGSATQDYLWQVLSEQAHLDGVLEKNMSVKKIMDTWTLQVGFPIVNATRSYRNNNVLLTQNRFLVKNTENVEHQTLWWIPITYKSRDNVMKSTWMRAEKEILIPNLNLSAADWLLLNVNQTGYYRVNYDDRNWRLLIHQLRKPRGHLIFDPKNRAQMLDDALNLAAAGYLSYETALNITRYLHQERDYVPWKAAFAALDYINDLFIRTAHYDKFKAYFVNLIDGVYKDLGFSDSPTDPQLVVYNRVEVLWRACKLEVVDCIVNAVRQFENWRNSPDPDKLNPISPNLREIVYCTAIRVGGQEHWDFAWQRYKNTNVGAEKDILMTALGCSREIWVLSRYLEWALTETQGIRKQDSPRVFTAVASNVVGQELAYRFMKNNWDRLKKYMGSSLMLSSVVRACTNKFSSRPEIDDLKRFAKSKYAELGVATRSLQQSIEHGEANIEWMERNFDKIVRWLRKTAR